MPKAKKQPANGWRNRITGHDLVDADQLLAHPANWRIHPQNQQSALSEVLDKVGWVQDVIVNQRTGFVVDGHLRISLAISKGEKVPVVYVDLTPEEEALVLASIDPLSAMAGTDSEKLDELLSQFTVEPGALADLLGGGSPAGESDFPSLPSGDKQPFQQITFTLHDEQAEDVKRALDAAKALGPFVDTPNENSNGNALARVCETFLTQYAHS